MDALCCCCVLVFSRGVNVASINSPKIMCESCSILVAEQIWRVVKIKASFARKAAVLHIKRAYVSVLFWLWKWLAFEFISQTEQRNEHREWRVPHCVLMKRWINPLNTVKRHPDAATRFTYWHDGASLIYASSKLGCINMLPVRVHTRGFRDKI